ncbi:MAG: tetratricopeptide repeat protein [Caulobacteraceae bacterium]
MLAWRRLRPSHRGVRRRLGRSLLARGPGLDLHPHGFGGGRGHWKAQSINTCDEALSTGFLDRRDTAATYVNRAILEMSREAYGIAEKNLDSALTLVPRLAEAHVDLGSTMINMRKYDEGVRETELGLSLGSKEPERGYYNLGIAYERLGNLQKAYESYRQAATLSPKWQDPKTRWRGSWLSRRRNSRFVLYLFLTCSCNSLCLAGVINRPDKTCSYVGGKSLQRGNSPV